VAALLGLQLTVVEGRVVVEGLVPSSPAASVGITPGDVIVEVGGERVRWREMEEVERQLGGEPGSAVLLQCQRAAAAGEGEGAPYQVRLVRGGGAKAADDVRAFVARAPPVRAAIEACYARLEDLSRRLEKEHESMLRKEKEWGQERAILTEERSEARRELETSRQQHALVVARIQALTQTNDELEKQRQACMHSIQSLRASYQGFAAKHHAASHALEAALSSTQKTCAALQERVASLVEHVARLEATTTEQQSQLDAMRSDAASREERACRAEAQLVAASAKIKALDAAGKEAEAEARALQQRVEGLSGEKQAVEQQLRALAADKNVLERRCVVV
jgi:chromosome segregation ATPase